ncbi:MAG TPA: NEW3 domain-containing protein [Candidatus Thermoplasmatota archaeon]|nr:NEW3 domain-containing protein [Candidatus Thermoplasmatota archaeon]
MQPPASIPRRLTPALLAACLLVPLLATPAQAAGAGTEPFSLMARPMRILRMVSDPWADGVWLGTEAGLFLKVGSTDVPQQVNVRDGLPHPFVWDVAPTPTSVWLGLPNGPVVLDKATRAIQPVKLADGSILSFPSRTVAVEGDQVWVGTEDHGLYRVNAATRVATPVANPVNGKPFTDPVMGVGPDGPWLYVSVDRYGLVEWNRDTGEAHAYNTSLIMKRPLYTRLQVTPAHVWVGTQGDGVVMLDRARHSMLQYAAQDNVNTRIVYSPRLLGSEVWFATQSGVSRYDEGAKAWRYWQNLPWGTGNDVAFLGGQVYSGTNQGKVIHYDRAHDRWELAAWWEGRSPEFNVIQSCDRVGDQLLFGTGGGGASYYDPEVGRWTRVGPDSGEGAGPGDISVTSTATDGASRFYGTFNGLAEYRPATHSWLHYRTDGEPSYSPFSDWVKQVRLTPDDAWVATLSTKHTKPRPTAPDVWSHGNLGRLDRATGAWTSYTQANGLSAENVTAVLPLGDTVWVGTHAGLDRLDAATGKAVKAYPAGKLVDPVFDILQAKDGSLWLASALGGLVSVDPKTGAGTPIKGLQFPAASVVEADGKLWLGTDHYGLYSYDPGSKAITAYKTGFAFDASIHCLLARQGILYVGDGWGVERLDLATGKWLPQVVIPSGGVIATPRVDFTSPALDSAVPTGGSVPLAGSAQGPDGAVVEVRAGDGPWSAATGAFSWRATVTASSGLGLMPVEARLLGGGKQLALATLWLDVGGRQKAASNGTLPAYDPTLEGKQDGTAEFTVQTNGLEGASGTVYLRLPGSNDWTALPMTLREPGVLAATSPRLLLAGDGESRVAVSWKDGAARFPQPLTGFGAAYPFSVRPARGDATPLLVGPATLRAPAGSQQVLEMNLQNTGTRPAEFAIQAGADAAAWVSGLPAPVVVNPGDSRTVRLNVTVPDGTAAGDYTLTISAHPDNSGTDFATNVTVQVGPLDAGSTVTKRGPAAPALLALAGALLVAGVVRRRRR